MKLVPALTAALCGFLSSTAAAAAHASSSNSTSWAASRTILSNDFVPPLTFKNINLLRTINLEKGYPREQINVVIENIDEKPQDKYLLPFMREDIDRVGGLEVWDKNDKSKKRFRIKPTGWLPYSPRQYFIIVFPEPLAPSAQLTLSINYYLVNSLHPLPAAIEQDDKQYLTYSFSAYTPSPYTTENQKIKVKFPNTDIPEYTETSDMKEGADPERQGSTLTYGPYKTADVHPSIIMPVTVRYEFTKPVIRCTLLERDIEVSHWGGNLATEDRFWLQNDGASLLKQFSRVSYAMKIYTNSPSTAVKSLKFPVKPGSVDPYFTDDIGNVSTSRFRPGLGKRDGLLELRPRYPVYGDWKYSFKIGWNNALSSFLRSAADQSYVLKVPFLEGPSAPEGVQYDKMDVRVILPEGASNVQFEVVGSGLPNDISSELGLYKTYMDTIGRTVLKVSATKVTDEARDSQLIVTYTYTFSAMLRKPFTIFGGILSVFVAAWVIGNLDVSIKKR